MSYKLIRLSAGIPERVDIPGRLILVDSVTTGQGVDIALLKNSTPGTVMPGRKAGFRLVEDFGGVILASALDCEVGVFLATNDVQLGGTAGGDVAIPSGVSVTNDLAHSIPVTLTSSTNTTPIPVSLASIRINNTPAQPIPVDFAGTVSPVLGVVTVDNTNAEAIPVMQKPGEVFEVHVNNVAPLAVSLAETKVNNTDAQAVPVRSQALTVIVDIAPAVVGVAASIVSNDATLRKLRMRNTSLTAQIAIGGVGVTLNSPIILGPGESYFEDDAAGAKLYAIADQAGATLQLQGLK